MSSAKDQAVCIGTVKYSESSQIVTLFCRDHGKIRAIAKGSRRPKGQFGGGIELLSAGEVIFTPVHGERSLATLHEFDLTEPFFPLRQSLLGLTCAQYAGDLLNQFTEEDDPHAELYDLFYETLRGFGETARPAAILLAFELTLLAEVGLAPVWRRCSACSGKLPDLQAGGTTELRQLYFSSGSGGMLCRDCEPAVVEKRFLEPEVLALLQGEDDSASAGLPSVLAAQELLSYHIRELLGKQSKMMVFVNRLLRQQEKAT